MATQSIARLVRQVVSNDLGLQDALQRRYANISALARIIRPIIEEKLGREVRLASVITTLKRVKVEYHEPSLEIQTIISKSVVNVRTDVAKLAIEKNRHSLAIVRKILVEHQESFLHLSEGISAITLIIDQKSLNEVRNFFPKDEILEEEIDLAAIIIQSPEKIIKTPGCAIIFYNQVSRRKINIEDTTSCHTDTIIVVRMEDIGRAFTALTELISNSRKNKIKKSNGITQLSKNTLESIYRSGAG